MEIEVTFFITTATFYTYNILHFYLFVNNFLKKIKNFIWISYEIYKKSSISLIKNNIELLKKYDDEKVYRKFNEILKELNIKGSIVNLRHTFATNNFYLGTPELFISRQMGHRTSQITKDNYTDIVYHLSKEKILKLYNNLYYRKSNLLARVRLMFLHTMWWTQFIVYFAYSKN